MNPFEFWASMWRNGAALAETGFKVAETMHASRAVIDSRSRTMAAASRDPLAGDYAELARMVPEKVRAFSEAGIAALADVQAMQAAALAGWQQWVGIAMAGRSPTMAEMAAMTSRSARMTTHATRAAGKALAPVHRTATSNARRLKRAKPR